MKKNYRRKNKQSDSSSYWGRMSKHKKHVLNQRSKSRRQHDRITLIKGLKEDEEVWEEIQNFENPVDWYAID